MEVGILVVLVLVVLLVIIVASGILIVSQSNAYIVERFGTFNRVLLAGLRYRIPFIDRVVMRVSLKEQVVNFDPQKVITKDNATVTINSIVYFVVTDAVSYTYGINNPIMAIDQLTATTLRNIIGQLDLEQILSARDRINSEILVKLDQATDKWGIKITRVEIKDIIPPADIQNAMEKQLRAERDKREQILRAEGIKESSILTAEGERQAAILRAEGEKQAMIERAKGRAESQRLVYEAQAKGIEYINQANPSQEYVQLQGYDALVKLGQNDSSKIIVPTDLQSLAGKATLFGEFVREEDR